MLGSGQWFDVLGSISEGTRQSSVQRKLFELAVAE